MAMTATNHVLAGSLIGAVLPLPLAAPLALLSHFVMDAIPHYGADENGHGKAKLYKLILGSDTLLALGLSIPPMVTQHWAMLLCGFLAYCPDIPIVYHFLRTGSTEGNHHWPFKRRLFTMPHHEFERGVFIEFVLFVAMLPLYIVQLR